jgi:mono/diheme cytochrome c family protein
MRIWKRSLVKSVSLALAATALGAFTFLFPISASAAENAAALYSDQCAGCHGATGNGDGPAAASLNPKPKPFKEALKGKNDAWVTKAIKEGGPAVGESNLMPPHGDLSGSQLHELVEYVKKL